jgi:GT2 family glycosyltransferase
MLKDVLIVLYYNKVNLTKACIQSILEANYPKSQIYCFDNGSKPGVFNQIKETFPGCHHQRCVDNVGFSGGFNRALRWAFEEGKSSVLFCTNDTLIYPGALEACLHTAKKTDAGMVAPLITYSYSQDAIDSIGGWFDANNCLLNHYHQRGLSPILDPEKDYIPGTALWIHQDCFTELGGTDESFFMYWEDVDISFRAHQKKLKLARSYESKISHGVGRTVHKKPLYTTYYFQRNRIRFCRRYLKGEALKNALKLLKRELLKMEKKWREKKDQKRLNYLVRIKDELEGI